MKKITILRLLANIMLLIVFFALSGCGASRCNTCCCNYQECPPLEEPTCPLPCEPGPNVCCPSYHCLPPDVPNTRVTTHYTGKYRAGLVNHLQQQGVQVTQIGDKVNIILFTDDCFGVGSANIKQSCYPIMDNIVELIQSYGTVPIRVTGYTDNVVDKDESWCLSQHLADSVVAYLWSHCVPLDYLLPACGRSSCEAIASIHTVRGAAFNRRVEIDLDRCGGDPARSPCFLRGNPCNGKTDSGWFHI